MSIAGSVAESVYYEEPYSVPGPCRTCCIRCPCPSILATLAFLGGVGLYCLGTVLGLYQTSDLFVNTAARDDMDLWISYVSIACYVEVVIMTVLAVALLAISCLGTGAVRKEYMWRFRTRAKGRCQTCIFMLVVYFLFLLWFTQCLLSVVPIVFYYVQKHGVCLSVGIPPLAGEDELCIELQQWAIVSYDYVKDAANRHKICGDDLATLCSSNVLLWFALAFFAAILIVLSMLHYLINYASNFAKLRDRFKDGFVNRKSGAYLVRAGGTPHSVKARSSLRGSRNNVLRSSRGSSHGSHASLRSISTNHGGSTNQVPNGANSTSSTLRIAPGYGNVLNGSGDELYAMRHLNRPVEYEKQSDSVMTDPLENRFVDQSYRYGSHNGVNEPRSMTSPEVAPNYNNGPARSHTSSSVSGGTATGNYTVNNKMTYGGEDYYPSANYNDIQDTVDGSVMSSVNDNGSEAVLDNRWGYDNQRNGSEERNNRRPLMGYSEPEPAPSVGSADSQHAFNYNEHFI